MGLLVKPSSISVGGSPSNQDATDLPLKIENFPTAEKNRGRSKKRWKKKNQTRRRTHETKGDCDEFSSHRSRTRSSDFGTQRTVRTVLLSEISESDSETVSPEGIPQEEHIAAAKVNLRRGDEKGDGEDEGHHKGDEKENTKDHYFNRLSVLSKARAASRSARSRRSTKFARIIGNFGQNRGVSNSSVSNNNKCHQECNENFCRRPSAGLTEAFGSKSSLFDFDEEEDDTYEKGEIHGTAQEFISGKEDKSIFEFETNINDEELDPIFVSDELDPLDDVTQSFVNERNENVVIRAPGDEKLGEEKVRDESTDDCEVSCEKEEEDETTHCASNKDIKNRKDVINGKNPAIQPNSLSGQPEPLWVKNRDKRNELAWARCAARSRRQPKSFPITRECKQKEPVEVAKGEDYSEKMCAPWYYSCGEVFVL